MIRLLLAEDQLLLRDALASLLQLEENIEVIAAVGNGREALEIAKSTAIDFLLLDIEMPELTGIEIAERLKNDNFYKGKIALLTTFSRPGYIEKAMIAKVDGYLLKDEPIETLVTSIQRIVAGERVISPDLHPLLFSLEHNPLQKREITLLRAVRDGMTTDQLAKTLHLSEGTIRNYLSSTTQKLGVDHRHDAVRKAEHKGWI